MQNFFTTYSVRTTALMSAVLILLGITACDSKDEVSQNHNTQKKYTTLDSNAPKIIAHRGLSGLYPEQTRIAYEKAADAGADMLELDMHMTKDCQLVARHNAWLSDSTNILQIAQNNKDFASRKRTTPGVLVDLGYDVKIYGGPEKLLIDLVDPQNTSSVLAALVVDGEDHTNDWSVSDFTLEELKNQLKGTILDNKAERPTDQNGIYSIISAQDVVDIARQKGKELGKVIEVYAESKNPYWNNAQAKANGCVGEKPFEEAIVKLLEVNDLNREDAPIYIQSFDPESIKFMRNKGLKAKAVQLFDGDSINFETGEVINITNDEQTFVTGRPYSWTLAGNPKTFADMQTEEGLKEIATYAQGIGPWKTQLLAHKVEPYFSGAKLSDVNKLEDTGLVEKAHKAGLVVHTFTLRSDPSRLAGIFKGDPLEEYFAYFRIGTDGVFTDFTDHGVQALKKYTEEVDNK